MATSRWHQSCLKRSVRLKHKSDLREEHMH
jgi:hypothetical protein